MECIEGARLFVDANLTALGRSLAAMHPGILHVGHTKWRLPADADDEVWLDYVGRCGWAYLTRDKKIRYRPRERKLLERHRMIALVLAARGDLGFEDQAAVIDAHWATIEQVIATRVPGIYHLTRAGLRLMEPF